MAALARFARPRRPPAESPRSGCARSSRCPNEIVAGPDGAMYTADSSLDKVWRIGDNGRVRSLRRRRRRHRHRLGARRAVGLQPRRRRRSSSSASTARRRSYPVSAGRLPERHRARLRRRAVVHRVARQRDRPRSTDDGKVTEYPLPDAGRVRRPTSPPGPDGALWFTESGANKIGRITTAGVITEFALPTRRQPAEHASPPAPTARCGSPSSTRNKIGRMTTDGVLTHEHRSPVDERDPDRASSPRPDGTSTTRSTPTASIARMALRRHA